MSKHCIGCRICREKAPSAEQHGKRNGRKGLRSYSSVGARVAKTSYCITARCSTITDVIESCGGMATGHRFSRPTSRAGPSSGLLPASMNDIPLDFDYVAGRLWSFIGCPPQSGAVGNPVTVQRCSFEHACRFFEDGKLRSKHALSRFAAKKAVEANARADRWIKPLLRNCFDRPWSTRPSYAVWGRRAEPDPHGYQTLFPKTTS